MVRVIVCVCVWFAWLVVWFAVRLCGLCVVVCVCVWWYGVLCQCVAIHSLGIEGVDVSVIILVPLLPSSRPFQDPQRQVPQSRARAGGHLRERGTRGRGTCM